MLTSSPYGCGSGLTLLQGEHSWHLPQHPKTRLTASTCVAAKPGGRDSACNLTFPVTLGPLAQLELQFSGVRDNAAVAGVRVIGPMAPTFKIQSFLQSDTASASPARGEQSSPQIVEQLSFGRAVDACLADAPLLKNSDDAGDI